MVTRWTQLGFGRTSATGAAQETPRNLMGFKDGTNNIKAEDERAMRRSVWVGPRDRPAWLRGGSYLVVRRIRMKLADWHATPVHEQERVIGRHKRSGAPLGGRHEHDPPDLEAGVERGDPAIPTDAHIRLTSPHANGGTRILRRSYNYDDGPGERDDALGAFIVHEASAVFVCPPAARPGGYVGEGIF